MSRKRIAVFGSTGSIGKQSLQIIAANLHSYELVAVSAYSSVDAILDQILQFQPRYASMGNADAYRELEHKLNAYPELGTALVPDDYEAILQASDAEIVINGLMGAAGLAVTRASLQMGLRLGLANKESLIMAGELVRDLATRHQAELIPVDSEHSAIFQCLLGEKHAEVSRLWITASGGPFRGWTREQLREVSPAQALAHPTWSMGQKISIDSASMMNKGLEVIEAHFLFDIAFDDISVIVHPQSIIHSMVEFCDASVKAHLGVTDMRIPIQYALSYPDRAAAPVQALNFYDISKLEFEAPDFETFGCLKLAFEAGRSGKTAPAILNAANEVAVAAFLSGRIGFLDIEGLVYEALAAIPVEEQLSFEQVLELDARTRAFCESFIKEKL